MNPPETDDGAVGACPPARPPDPPASVAVPPLPRRRAAPALPQQPSDPALPTWLADPALQPVWRRLRAPLERHARTTRLSGLDRDTRHALSALLGRAVTGDVRVVLADFEQAVGRPLVGVVEAVTGRLRDPQAEREARRQPLDVLGAVDPEWEAAVRTSGVLTGLADPLEVARTAVVIRCRLPGPVRLRTELAAETTGDAHALDDGRPLATVVLRGLHPGPLPATAAGRRAVWEEAGVLADTVSTSVLTVGLRPLERSWLNDAADRGDPVHLTEWHLRRLDLRVAGPVLVVENPSVLEAFAVAGRGDAVVCTSGWPAPVAVALLRRLGAPLAYHGDFDWPGIRIAGWLVDQARVAPWRMTATDYLSAPGGEPLTGVVAPTPWDPGLADAMRERGTAVHEEQVVAGLLTAWASGPR